MTNTPIQTAAEIDAYFSALPKVPQRSARLVMLDADDSNGFDAKDIDDAGALVSSKSPTIIAFADDVSDEDRPVIARTISLAEKIGNQTVALAEDPVKWLQAYTEALGFCGWTTSTGVAFTQLETAGISLTMDSIVLDLIGAIAGPNKAAVVTLMKGVLDQLLGNEPLTTVFQAQIRKGRKANLQIMPCVRSAKGTPVTYMLAINCDNLTEEGGALFWKWSVTSMNVEHYGHSLEFNRSNYDDFSKQYVEANLQGSVSDYFARMKKIGIKTDA